MKCEVIIPVGPGHEEIHNQAIESVRIATLDKGPFSTVNIQVIDDTRGELGRSKARNLAVEACNSDWIFFLDADDRIHPNAFMSVSLYDNDYDAIWGNILELNNGVAVWRYQVPRITSLIELLSFDPFMTIGPMGHFVRTEVAKQLPFDEDMDCGEDWDFYLREWKGFRCLKQEAPFILNYRQQHSTGPRSATGVDWMNVVHPMLRSEHAKATLPSREYWLEKQIKEHGFKNGAELGVWYGRTFNHLLLTCHDLNMIGVDTWEVKPEMADIECGETYEEWDMKGFEAKLRKGCSPFGNRARIIKNDTHNASKLVDDDSLDFIFIDAGHDEGSITQDYNDWEPKVRSGGMVSGHDIDWASVQSFLAKNVPEYKIGPDNIWYYFKV